MTELSEKAVEILRRDHCGRERRILVRHLSDKLGLHEWPRDRTCRRTTKALADAVNERLAPICAAKDGGIYLATTKEEKDEGLKVLGDHVFPTLKRMRNLEMIPCEPPPEREQRLLQFAEACS